MTLKTSLSRLMLVAGFFLMANGLTAAKLPVEAFFAEPDCSRMKLAPDGKHVAFLTTLGLGKVGIALMDLQTGQFEALVSAGNENIKEFFWKGSDYIVYGGDVGGEESYAWRSIPIATPKPGAKRQVVVLSNQIPRERRITGEVREMLGTIMSIADPLRYDPYGILVFAAPLHRPTTMYTMDVRTGGLTEMPNYELPGDNAWLAKQDVEDVADNRGVLRARSRVQGGRILVEVRPDVPGKYVQVRDFALDGPGWDLLFFGADNETLYLLSTEKSDTSTLHTFNIRTRQLSEPLFNVPDGEIVEVLMSWDRSQLEGVVYETDKRRVHYFSPERARLQATIDGALPGTTNWVVGESLDQKIVLVAAASDRDPGTYYILDRTRGRLGAVGKTMRAINPAEMRPMEPVSFQARDGRTIHGYLTRPAGDAAKPSPLILNPHGGPFGIRDSWGFNPEVQFLANRGYAVLQVNYRGSGGYGRDFLRAGYREWGGKMQDDLTDAVKWAIDQKVADPNQIAIYGASYGGYATLMGLALTPELYRCGVNYVGVTDLSLIVHSPDRQSIGMRYFFKEAVGAEKQYVAQRSPVNLVDRIRVPLLNAYGENDPRVEFRHWKLLESKLKQYGKNYEIMVEDNEGHGFRNEANRLVFYRRLEAFFAKNLPVATN